MKVEEFVSAYSAQYMSIFHEEIQEEIYEEVHEEKKKPKKTALTKISEFLFEPRYEVNNLKFKKLES